MLARRILSITVLATCIFLILVLVQSNDAYLMPLVVSVFVLVFTYIFQYQINWFYYQKFPPKLPDSIGRLFAETSSFYQSLSKEKRELFGSRVTLFIEAKEFHGRGMEEVPEDVKYIVGYYAIRSVWPREKFLFKEYGNVVIYPHPFLSPAHPDQVHTVEAEHEDGTLIYSLEHLMAGFFQRKKYFPIGFYSFAEILLRHEFADWHEPPEDFWTRVEREFGWSKEMLSGFIGLPLVESRTLAFSLYLHNPGKMHYLFPELTNPFEGYNIPEGSKH